MPPGPGFRMVSREPGRVHTWFATYWVSLRHMGLPRCQGQRQGEGSTRKTFYRPMGRYRRSPRQKPLIAAPCVSRLRSALRVCASAIFFGFPSEQCHKLIGDTPEESLACLWLALKENKTGGNSGRPLF